MVDSFMFLFRTLILLGLLQSTLMAQQPATRWVQPAIQAPGVQRVIMESCILAQQVRFVCSH